MTAPINRHRLTRRAVLRGGALTVGFVFAGVRTQALAQWATAAPRALDPNDVDFSLHEQRRHRYGVLRQG